MPSWPDSFNRSTSASTSASDAVSGSRSRSAREPRFAPRLQLEPDVDLRGRILSTSTIASRAADRAAG